MTSADEAWELAEAIRLALIRAHYPKCEPGRKGMACGCGRKHLEEAFKRYADAHPERFEVF